MGALGRPGHGQLQPPLRGGHRSEKCARHALAPAAAGPTASDPCSRRRSGAGARRPAPRDFRAGRQMCRGARHRLSYPDPGRGHGGRRGTRPLRGGMTAHAFKRGRRIQLVRPRPPMVCRDSKGSKPRLPIHGVLFLTVARPRDESETRGSKLRGKRGAGLATARRVGGGTRSSNRMHEKSA